MVSSNVMPVWSGLQLLGGLKLAVDQTVAVYLADNHDGTFFISTEWQLLSSLTALATSTSLESTNRRNRGRTGRLLVLVLLYYINDACTEYYTTP